MSSTLSDAATLDEYNKLLTKRFYDTSLLANEMYIASYGNLPESFTDSVNLRVALKLQTEYCEVKNSTQNTIGKTKGDPETSTVDSIVTSIQKKEATTALLQNDPFKNTSAGNSNEILTTDTTVSSYSTALVSAEDYIKGPKSNEFQLPKSRGMALGSATTAMTDFQEPIPHRTSATDAILKQRRARSKEPEWHAPWKLKRVIAGHQGWVYNSVFDPSNEWFATCSSDRTIKIWDLASGTLKLTLTGHVASVRDLAISNRHPYLFSASEDREVKCWDLETNRVVRNYHGHLSGVYAVKVHPTLDLVITGGRDSSCRVWDMRMKTCVRTLVGHRHTVSTIGVQGFDPQILTGSYDATVKLWDLRAGRAMTTLTHHKKSIRSLVIHPFENAFASASTDNVKMWHLPQGEFMRNAEHSFEIVNSLAINRDNVLVAGSDIGRLEFFDWKTGHKFQEIITPPQPGSLHSERGIFGASFDMTGTRLVTTEADKTIKIYHQDEDATPLSHPVVFNPKKRSRF